MDCILFSFTVREPHYSPISPPQAPQQPTTILQQLPATAMPPSIRAGGGHVKQGIANCHHTQAKSYSYFLPVCHITCLLASAQIYYL